MLDPKGLNWNTLVGTEDTTVQVREDDYVRVEGVVKGAFEGQNAFGQKIVAPMVEANSVEVVPAIEAASEPKRSVHAERPRRSMRSA